MRVQEVNGADQELAQALARLEELEKVNERLAQDRLDQMRMEHLAQRQEDLGKRLRELAAKDQNDARQTELALLRAEQDTIARELDDLAEQSRLFKESLREFRADQAKQLAQKARALAREQRAWSAASQEMLLRELIIKLAELARKQDDLAARAEQLGREVRGEKAVPHFPQAREAAEALHQGKAVFALQAQEKSLTDLARLAGDLDRDLDVGKTPREAALKLVRAQERIRKDLEHLGEQFPSLTEKQVRALLQDILAAQQNLVRAMLKLEIPASLPKAQAAKTQADDAVRQVEDYLKTRDGLTAFNKMEEAVDALRRLADTLPEAQPPPVSPKESPEQKAARNKARQAQDLAREQKDLQEAVRKAFEEVLHAPPAPADADRAQLDDKHGTLAKEIDKLADDLMKLAAQDRRARGHAQRSRSSSSRSGRRQGHGSRRLEE